MQNTEYADFNWEKCTLHVQPKAWRKFRLKGKSKKKSAKDRFIPIPAKLVWKIKDRMRERDAQPHDLVFPNGEGKPDGHFLRKLKASPRTLLVEEMGQTSGINRILETSTISSPQAEVKLSGADLYRSEVHGEITFKLASLMNEAPHIEPDPAFRRRVQVFPFRARFDEAVNPGCIEMAMERKNAPSCLRESPHRLSAMLRAERRGILYKWIQAAQRFIANGEELGNAL
jgi:hypothetical protein